MNSSWVENIWNWADKNHVSDLEWIEHDSYLKGGYFRGLPRNKEVLLNLTELNLLGSQVTHLPVEIGKLINLKKLYLLGNQLTAIPV